jgi:hypothetical protein
LFREVGRVRITSRILAILPRVAVLFAQSGLWDQKVVLGQ